MRKWIIAVVGIVAPVMAVLFSGFGTKLFELVVNRYPAISPVPKKISNSQYTVYMHRCQSADYNTPEFKSLEDALSAIEGALKKKGFSSVKMGEPQEKCDMRSLTVIALYRKDEDVAKEAKFAIDEILPKNRKASYTVEEKL